MSENFFPLLGVQPELGRGFNADEAKWNGPKAVLLSHSLWERRFGFGSGDRRPPPHLERRADHGGWRPARIVRFRLGVRAGKPYRPVFPFSDEPGNQPVGQYAGNCRPPQAGVSPGSAAAEVKVIAQQITSAHPERNGFGGNVTPLTEHVSGPTRPALVVLGSAVGVVLLIVCANLSNLLLVRAAARQKEMAVRTALGAARRRLVRQMLTESVVLSCCGAVIGVGLAIAGTRLLARLDAVSIPLLQSVRVDTTALAFAMTMAVVAGLIFGIAPALQIPSTGVHDALKESSRSSTEGRRGAWLRSTLVVCEVAFACVLLVGAGLLIRSFLQVLDVNLGFQPERTAALRVDPDRRLPTQDEQNAYFDDVLRRARAVPGIEAAALTDALPLGRNRSWGVGAKGQVYARGQAPVAFVRIISDDYMKAMGIQVRSGRELSARDDASSEGVVVINDTMARRVWPGKTPSARFCGSIANGGWSVWWPTSATWLSSRAPAWKCICRSGKRATTRRSISWSARRCHRPRLPPLSARR